MRLHTKLHTVIVSMLLIFLSCGFYPLRTEQADYSRFDFIYSEAGNKLYNQDEITDTEDFKNASLIEKQDMLEAYFDKKRVEAYITSIKKTSYYAALAIPIPLALFYSKDYLKKIPSYVYFAGAVAFSSSIGDTIKGAAYQTIASINVLIRLYFSSQGKSELEKYERDYVRNKPWIEQKLQGIIEDNLIQAHSVNQKSTEDFIIGILDGGDGLKLYLKHLKLALSLPRQVKHISYTRELVNQRLTGYSGEALRNLKRYCIRHVAASKEQSARKIAAYFCGAPGVGKTRAARLIAQVLDLPFEVISLGDLTIDGLVGTPSDPGLLLDVLSRAKINGEGAKNMILLIDDADRVVLNESKYGLVSFILTLLEPETKTFYSPYLWVDIDISHLGIILAGNAEITDEALHNRLHVIHFDAYAADYKKTVAWNELLPGTLAQHKTADLKIDESDITEHDVAAINNMIEQDPDPGFRSIKLKLMNYLEDKVLCKYFAQDGDGVTCAKQDD